jgi:hypothetical protein
MFAQLSVNLSMPRPTRRIARQRAWAANGDRPPPRALLCAPYAGLLRPLAPPNSVLSVPVEDLWHTANDDLKEVAAMKMSSLLAATMVAGPPDPPDAPAPLRTRPASRLPRVRRFILSTFVHALRRR